MRRTCTLPATGAVVAATIVATTIGFLPLPAEAVEFSNPDTIILPAPGPGMPPPTQAVPYPSTINVSGLSGTVSDVNLTLNGWNCSAVGNDYAYPEDVDILLVGPSGENVVVLSDVGGSNETPPFQFSAITVRLDDQAANPLPADSQMSAGTYRPTDDDNDTGEWGPEVTGHDPFPAPAPAPSAVTTLSAFNGTTPNGAWSLFVVDDFPGPDNCTIDQGWTLDILTTTPSPSPSPSVSATATASPSPSESASPSPSPSASPSESASPSASPSALPPDCSLVTASPGVLKAHGKMQQVTLAGATAPDGQALTYAITGVTQDEPTSGGYRNDLSTPDANGVSGASVSLRGERNPSLNGRVYRIAYTVSTAGGACSGTASVGVPTQKNSTAIDDGERASWNSFTGALIP